MDGMHVADLGAGSGGYALPAAQAVGPRGRVYAIEVQKDLVARMANIARTQARNVEVVWGDVERLGGTKLADRSIDACIAANLLFLLEDRHAFVDEMRRILKLMGKALVIDWSGSFDGTGPHPDHVMTLEEARMLFERAGFVSDKIIDVGAHHWGLICRRVS